MELLQSLGNVKAAGPLPQPIPGPGPFAELALSTCHAWARPWAGVGHSV
jgi:hypothetical protein